MRILLITLMCLGYILSCAQHINPYSFYHGSKDHDARKGGKELFEELLRRYNKTYRIKDSTYQKLITTEQLGVDDTRIRYESKAFDIVTGLFLIKKIITTNESMLRYRDNLFVIKVDKELFGVLVKRKDTTWTIRPLNHIPWWYPGKRTLDVGAFIFVRP